MPSRADVDTYRAALDRAVALAQRDLANAFSALRGLPNETIRDGLIEVFESISARYGDVAASAAADFYERQRATAFPNYSYTPRLASPISQEQAESTVRYAADHLFNGDPEDTLKLLNGNLQRYVENSARETIHLNAGIDRTRPRWARVPAGGKTCAWCLMLSSRGWVYGTETSAGGKGNAFHNDDRCLIVPSWEKRPQLDGYDPDAMYKKYTAARLEVIADGMEPTDERVAQRLRDMFPDEFTDGSSVPSILRDAVNGWPKQFRPVSPGRWGHIKKRHLPPDGEAQDLFPEVSEYEVAKIIRETANAPDLVDGREGWDEIVNFHKVINGREYLLGAKMGGDGLLTVRTSFPPGAGRRRIVT